MQTDISIYKCMVQERLEKIKEETYGNSCYYKKHVSLQSALIMLVKIFN